MSPDLASGEPRPALFLDFDGTLVDIAERPEDVVVDPGLPDLLVRLHGLCGGAAAIVTGRRVGNVSRFLPGVPLDICGLHGLERRVGGRVSEPDTLPDLAAEVAVLQVRFPAETGILIEDKRVGVALHWRLAPHLAEVAHAAIGELASRLGPAYRVQDGKAVREILPASAGKGGAVRDLMRIPPYAGRRPLFIGDDRTDEGGFVAANELGGASLKVGPGPSAATRRIASPGRLRAWLGSWDGNLAALEALEPA